MTRRVVCAFLPRFAIERWQILSRRRGDPPSDEVPVVLATEGPHGRVVHAANRTAMLAGVSAGARVVDMQAFCPGLRVEYADLQGDALALDRLVLWARRWCPWTARDGADGIVMDSTGSDHLWGGEAPMLAEIEGRLATLGFTARLAVAPTWGAAWALARFGPERAICGDPQELAPLPVAALRLNGDTLRLLDRLGLKRVGDLLALPRNALARRFTRTPAETHPLIRLDQAMGRSDEPISSREAEAPLRATLSLPEPILDPRNHLPALAADLAAQLAGAERGARQLCLTVYRTDGETRRIGATTALPVRDPVRLAELFTERVEALDPGFGFDLLSFEATRTEHLSGRQTSLTGEVEAEEDLAQMIDRLTMRFGAGRISQPAPRASHIPERSLTRIAPLAPPPDPPPALLRPLRLLDPPEEVRVLYAVPDGPPQQFLWRRQVLRVSRYEGPERIAPEWWQDRPGTRLRDYFRIEDARGRRFWIYREGLHGDGRGGDPRWFLQGFFD
ncbi:Y-family DNA polymerase [Palleronia caenipelagi]|uniref:DNA polymerase Y family protein n=1 Tax=Palleronia caenipelagi TaxID=2489174 RepID=A0A547Q8R6_9RHOB|nr:DNA polymerase Y family protein [Palleronia caenipelagi]TRD22771.1 DNA polymerase Y family protein [Palleronia caenipelagi]